MSARSWRELVDTGYLTNQARMWLSSHWTVRHGWGWRDGEDLFFRHLLDGSRAANRAGWQWTVGALTGKPYGFSRWQVEKRAPELCRRCPVSDACHIQDCPEDQRPEPRSMLDPRMRRDDDVEATAGPGTPQVEGRPEAVWITAESLGRDDPALMAHADLAVRIRRGAFAAIAVELRLTFSPRPSPTCRANGRCRPIAGTFRKYSPMSVRWPRRSPRCRGGVEFLRASPSRLPTRGHGCGDHTAGRSHPSQRGLSHVRPVARLPPCLHPY